MGHPGLMQRDWGCLPALSGIPKSMRFHADSSRWMDLVPPASPRWMTRSGLIWRRAARSILGAMTESTGKVRVRTHGCACLSCFRARFEAFSDLPPKGPKAVNRVRGFAEIGSGGAADDVMENGFHRRALDHKDFVVNPVFCDDIRVLPNGCLAWPISSFNP